MTAHQVRDLLAGLGSDRANVRFASAKALCHVSEEDPKLIYPQFDRVLELLHQGNQILQWNAMRVLSHLAAVDSAGKLDAVLDEYLAPLRGPSMIGAAEAVAGGAIIAAAKPKLASAILHRILGVERGQYATEECRNVVIGHALRACERMLPLVEDRAPVRAFAARHVNNPRPATRHKAERLLARLPAPAARVAHAGRRGVQ